MNSLMNSQSTITRKRTKANRRDESALVRTARLANAVAFANYIISTAKNAPAETVRRREIYQATVMLGGLLFEVTKLLDELAPIYGMRPFYSDLLVFRAVMRRFDDILAEYSFSSGYHHESAARATEEALGKQQLDLCSIAASCDLNAEFGTFFGAAFAFDTNSLVAALAKTHGREELFEFACMEMPHMAERFLTGANRFIDGLTGKLMMRRTRSK